MEENQEKFQIGWMEIITNKSKIIRKGEIK